MIGSKPRSGEICLAFVVKNIVANIPHKRKYTVKAGRSGECKQE